MMADILAFNHPAFAPRLDADRAMEAERCEIIARLNVLLEAQARGLSDEARESWRNHCAALRQRIARAPVVIRMDASVTLRLANLQDGVIAIHDPALLRDSGEQAIHCHTPDEAFPLTHETSRIAAALPPAAALDASLLKPEVEGRDATAGLVLRPDWLSYAGNSPAQAVPQPIIPALEACSAVYHFTAGTWALGRCLRDCGRYMWRGFRHRLTDPAWAILTHIIALWHGRVSEKEARSFSPRRQRGRA